MSESSIELGEAIQVRIDDPNKYSQNASSRYADAVAWLAVESARRALICVPGVLTAREETAVLAISEYCTLGTIRSIAERIHKGRLSPLHFAGANPGLLAGLVCMEWGLRGPSLTLTMPPQLGLQTARLVARGWLKEEQARYVLLITHEFQGTGHTASCQIIGKRQ